MIKSIVVHDLPIDWIPALERWYHRDHSPEIARRYGPWLERHESYIPLDVPADARAFGFYNWRVTECFWRELPKPGPQGALSFTPPPVWFSRVATCLVPPQPTEDFLGFDCIPSEKVGLRWYILLRYPTGVPWEEGERWFLDVFAPEVARQPTLYRFFSYQVLRGGGASDGGQGPGVHELGLLPGTWRPGDGGPAETRWDRVLELWYETFSDWRASIIQQPPRYTVPAWATSDIFPFVRPYEDFVSSFILERPNDEFLRDLRSYLP